MPHSTATTKIILSTEAIDDLVYFSRVGDLSSLQDSIDTLSKAQACSPLAILQSAIDIDEDGLGSGSCLLHYPAANGNAAVISYLLSLIGDLSVVNPTSTNDGTATDSGGNDVADTTAQSLSELSTFSGFINHQNVSGNTALHWAGMNGHLPIVQALMKAGASPEIVNAAGRDAVVESEWSSKEGAAECAVWMLKECGGLEKGVGESAREADGPEVGDDVDEDTTAQASDTQIIE